MFSKLECLIGPLAARELILESRRPIHFVFRAVIGAILLFMIYVVASTYHSATDAAANLAEKIILLQWIAAIVVVPSTLVSVVAGEREQTTIQLLACSPLSNLDIIFSKFFGKLVIVGVLLAIPIPVIATLSLVGGVDFGDVLLGEVIVAATVLLLAGISLFASVICSTAISAFVLTGIAFLILCVLPFTLTFDVLLGGPMTNAFKVWMVGTNIFHLQGHAHRPAFATQILLGSLANAAVGLLFAGAAWLAFQRSPRGIRRRRRHSIVRRISMPLFPNRLAGLIPITNPLWLRARLSRAYDRDRMLWWAQCVWIAFTLGTSVFEAYKSSTAFGSTPISRYLDAIRTDDLATWYLLAISVGYLAAMSFPLDKQKGIFPAMVASPMTSRTILVGTVFAILEHFRPLIGYAIFLGIERYCFQWALQRQPRYPLTIGSIGLEWLAGSSTVILFLVAGLGIGLRASRPAAAASTFFLVLVYFFVGYLANAAWLAQGTFAVAAVVSTLLFRRFSPVACAPLLLFSLVGACVLLLTAFSSVRFSVYDQHTLWPPLQYLFDSVYFSEADLTYDAITKGIFCLLCGILFFVIYIARFDRWVGRSDRTTSFRLAIGGARPSTLGKESHGASR